MTTSNHTNIKSAERGVAARTAITSTDLQTKAAKTPKKTRQPKAAARQSGSRQNRPEPHSPLKKSFLLELSGLLDAETQLVEALPKIAAMTANRSLRQAIQHHLAETKQHAKRIRVILKNNEVKPMKKGCDAMKAIIAEGAVVMAKRKSEAQDSQIIAVLQKVEHYEIAAYGTLRSWARNLEDRNAWELVSQTLDEEKQADYSLTIISEAANVPASDEKQTENAHQERSIMPSQQNQRGRSDRDSQERDDHGRFESHDNEKQSLQSHDNGRRTNQPSSNQGRNQSAQNSRQESSGQSGYSNQGQGRSSSPSSNYGRRENETYGQSGRGGSRSQGIHERDEHGRFEGGNSQGGQNYASRSGNQNWNDQDNGQEQRRSQSSQYRDQEDNGRFQYQDSDENQVNRSDRNQNSDENENYGQQGNSRFQNSQQWDENRDSERQNSGDSDYNQGSNQRRNDYNEGQSQRNQRTTSQSSQGSRGGRERSTYD